MPQKTKEAQAYQGSNRDQTFVARYEKNPRFDGQLDRRYFQVAALWRYCCQRHREFWTAQGEPERSVPQHYHGEKEFGWQFPSSWVSDFMRSPQSFPEKTLARLPRHDGGGNFPKQKEFRRWNLPAGTIVQASDATIHYPDGSVETWGDIRRRLRTMPAAEAA